MADPTVSELRAALEVALAQRDRALVLLNKVERAFPSGHSTPETQQTLRETRSLLVETGTRKSDAPPVWRDRR